MANVLMTKYTKKQPKVKRKKAKPRIKKKVQRAKPKPKPKRKKAKAKVKRAKAKPRIRSPKQRARAAKKGWKKRKERERDILKKARKAKRNQPSEVQVVDFIVRDLAKRDIMSMIRAMPEREQEAALEKIIKAYTDAEFIEVEEDQELLRIRTRLRIADEEGNLDEVMELIAQEYNMPPSEVYTQWLYCGVQ